MNTLSPLQPAPTGPLFSRRQGAGESVICLHSSTGSHAQWRALTSQLGEGCETIAVDLHGHGRSPAWSAAAANTLDVDAAAVGSNLPPLDRDGSSSTTSPVHLVGHSYGAAVALQMALRQPQRVRSLTLYEPVPFGVIGSRMPGDAAFGEIRDIADSVARLVRRGELESAARIFVAYWGGAAAWAAMAVPQRTAVIDRIVTVPRHFEALFRATWGAGVLARLTMPILLIEGSRTRAPAQRIAALLAQALPHLQRVEIDGAGHLGPMTHATPVNAAIQRHLAACGLQAAAPTFEPGAEISGAMAQ